MKHNAVYLMLTAVLAMVLAPAALADCRNVRIVRHNPVIVHTPTIVKEVVAITPITPVVTVVKEVIGIPTYNAVYNPFTVAGLGAGYPGVGPVTGAAPVAGVDPCADLRGQVAEMRLQLRQLQQGRTPGPMPRADDVAPEPQPQGKAAPERAGSGTGGFVPWAASRCASCHSEKTARDDGGGFVLINKGQVADLTPQQAGEVIRRLSVPADHKDKDGKRDAMPKGKPLPAADKLEGIRLFVEGAGP